ncbi:pyridoxal phosphate-dependent aminotransferase [Algoriphagus machipongonensis]|uniref:histidinol-phosphate transaminase n=1 Tax=Algoriphagus machipongonensis TaxID=388413 RepID=A3HRT6_9BACT|nr:histidinol-phosphate transaminase [Algoriphagus machipongonensis]EAZ82554.1 histidinol-phosphate transaminase [Algoriphagus machipongonensis]
MTGISRRSWIKRASLGSSLALFGVSELTNSLTAAEIRKYNPRKLDNPIRLGSNENPYGPSESVRNAMQSHFDLGCRYPWSYNSDLVKMLSEKEGVPEDHIVLVAGSTEGLKITGITFGSGGEIISCSPTFLTMMTYSELWGTDINWVPLTKDLDFDLDEIEKRVSSKTKLVFLCNPNNPTGKLLPADRVRDFCETVSKKAIVFSDEAYYDYITEPNYPSMLELVKEGKDVIVSKTFSKVYGLAGIRLGYLIAKPEIANKLRDRVVANTNIMAIEAGKAALKDTDFYNFSVSKAKDTKQMITQTLDELKLPYLESHTNFLFFHTGRDIIQLNEEFANKGIIIGRPFPPLNDWCRISTGTLEEVSLFNSTLKEVFG